MPRTGAVWAGGGHVMRGEHVVGQLAGLRAGQGAGDGVPVAGQDGVEVGRRSCPRVEVAVGDDRVDHPDEAHALAVLGGEDDDARLAQALDLGRER